MPFGPYEVALVGCSKLAYDAYEPFLRARQFDMYRTILTQRGSDEWEKEILLWLRQLQSKILSKYPQQSY